MSRRQQALDAAIRVLGTHGARRLTHRAVDAEAGLPAGSASNYFRTREALVEAVLGRLIALEQQAWAEVATDLGESGPIDADAFAAALGELLRDLTGRRRVITLARLAVFVEAAVQPVLRTGISDVRADLEKQGTEWLRRLGSRDPVHDLWGLMALLDGQLINQCTTPDPAFDPEPAIRTFLRGIVR
ncbi:TetR/AcrR family transcriptional regulator [Amycolatopsis pigmentata]|uniref:TetR/AcrR family transcriptional regulator n=1 Tax=Amycolatopsis pigmentata TaxID=450801 RepID=A0ABW5FPL9_9PSEU